MPKFTRLKDCVVTNKNVIVREPVNIIINKVVEEEKQEPIIFESLIKTNITTSKPATILNFKDKLLTEEQIVKPVIEQIVKPVIVTDNEYKKAKRERKAITNVMCKIVTDMVANGERQRRFYDSIYGQGAYDYEYEKIIDKFNKDYTIVFINQNNIKIYLPDVNYNIMNKDAEFNNRSLVLN